MIIKINVERMDNNMSSGKISVAKDTKPTKEQFEEYVFI